MPGCVPLVELKLRSGRLDEADIDQLTTDLSLAAIETEGSDLERAGGLTWTLVETFADGEWRVGGEPATVPTYIVRATLVGGPVSEADKERSIARADDAIRTVDPDYDPGAAWVVTDELSDGEWGAGGIATTSDGLAEVIGVESDAP